MKKIRKKPKKKTFIRAYKSVDRQSDPTCVEIHIFFVPNLRFQMRLRTRWYVENVTQSTRILRRPKKFISNNYYYHDNESNIQNSDFSEQKEQLVYDDYTKLYNWFTLLFKTLWSAFN